MNESRYLKNFFFQNHLLKETFPIAYVSIDYFKNAICKTFFQIYLSRFVNTTLIDPFFSYNDMYDVCQNVVDSKFEV